MKVFRLLYCLVIIQAKFGTEAESLLSSGVQRFAEALAQYNEAKAVGFPDANREVALHGVKVQDLIWGHADNGWGALRRLAHEALVRSRGQHGPENVAQRRNSVHSKHEPASQVSCQIPKNIIVIPDGLPTKVAEWPIKEWGASYAAMRRNFPESGGFTYVEGTMNDILECFQKYFPDKAEELFGPHAVVSKRVMFYDAGRACLLYEHGGLYMDLDYEPLTNFWDRIPCNRELVLMQSPYVGNEEFQNSVMAAPPRSEALAQVIRRMRFTRTNILHGTGPQLYDEIIKSRGLMAKIGELPCAQFQPAALSLHGMHLRQECKGFPRNRVGALANGIVGIHWSTCVWGNCQAGDARWKAFNGM